MNIQHNQQQGLYSSLPFVSIVIPCRNEVSCIQACLDSILAQDYPREKLEVLVIDGMSDDGTREIVNSIVMGEREKYFEKNSGDNIQKSTLVRSVRIAIIDNPVRLVPVALNIGFEYARGEIIFRLDGHSELAPNYIRACVVKLLENPQVGCVGGPSVATGSGFLGAAYSLALQSPFGVGGGTFRTARSEQCVDTLAFGGYKRRIFKECGPFDMELARNQDIAFNAEVRKRGYRLLLIPTTFTSYHGPNNFARILRQNFGNGYWNTKVLNKMVGVLSWRHFIPIVFIWLLLFTAFLHFTTDWGWIPFFLLVGSYLGCSVSMTAWELIKRRKKEAILLPLVFPSMHLSYGTGSFIGLFRFLAGVLVKNFINMFPCKLFNRLKMCFKPIS